MSPTSVVLGCGQIGNPLATALVGLGHRVRQVSRRGLAVDGAEGWPADLSDPDAAAAALGGADVAYQAINAPYTAWPKLLQPLQDGVVEGARRAGVRLVVLDNLYAYGRATPIGPTTPLRPCSRKGALRARLHEGLLAAGERQPIAIAKAADFVGSGVREALIARGAIESLVRGGRVWVPGDPTLPRDYSYLPDVVRGLLALGADAEARGVFMLPALHTSSAELVGALADAAGVPARIARIPSGLVGAVGLLVPMAREIHEMLYQWEAPFVVDDSAFIARFGVTATPLADAARQTVAEVTAADPC